MKRLKQSGDRDDLLGQVVDEYFHSVERGETPVLADYQRRYPSIADLLKVAIPAMQAAQDVAPAPHSGPSEAYEAGPAKQLGDFRIIYQLGRGGMGIVYEAEQISMGRRVALKVLPLAGLVDEQRIQRFQNEVRAVAALDHPHIVSVYTVGQERGVHYYAMQLIRGRSLAEIIATLRDVRDDSDLNGESLNLVTRTPEADLAEDAEFDATEVFDSVESDKLSTAKVTTVAKGDTSTFASETRRDYFRNVANLGIQAASALQHAHDQGVIHRDIKPANLLVDASSQLYVTDFGLARMEADAGVTMTGDIIGTLRYMAPEQALAKRVVVDHRADIYSLAVTLYEFLTLQPAYAAEDRHQLLKQIAFEEPAALRRIDPQIPPELETIVQKAMSKDMDERYATAQELADDLQCFLENRPIKAKAPTFTQRISKWTRRNPTVAWASIVTLALAVVTFAVATLLVARQRDKAQEQLRIAAITRLASESHFLHDERPIRSILLATEAVKLSQQNGEILPIAHEALLNATQRSHIGRILKGHGSKIFNLKMTTDWLVTEGDGKVHLWELASDSPWASPIPIGRGNEKFRSIFVSKDGHWLVTVGDRLLRWDLSKRNPNASPEELASTKVSCESLGPNGRWFAAQVEQGIAKIWDLNAIPARSRTLPAQTAAFNQIVTDGERVAATNAEGALLLWDLESEEETPTVLHRSDAGWWLRSIAISPDHRWLAFAGSNRNGDIVRLLRLGEEASQEAHRVLPRVSHGPLGYLRFSPDSRWLFALEGFTGRFHRWDLNDPNPTASASVLKGHRVHVHSLAITHDSSLLLSGGRDGTVRLWDLDAADPLAASNAVQAHDTVKDVAVHPNGHWFATASEQGTARLWDRRGVESALSAFVLSGHTDDVRSSTVTSSTGRWIATTTAENAVQLWDTEAHDRSAFARVLRGPEAYIRALQISPDDRWLAAGCRNNVAYIWDLQSQDVAASLQVCNTHSNSMDMQHQHAGRIAIGPNSRWLTMARGDRGVQIWDLMDDRPNESSRTLTGHDLVVLSMAFSPDGRWLATGAENFDGPAVRLWDLKSADMQASSRPLPGHTADVYCLAFDEGSRYLATAGGATVRIWDLKADPSAPPREIRPLPEHSAKFSDIIWRMALSPNGRWLFTSRFNRTAQLWDLSQADPTCFEIPNTPGVMSVAISHDSRWLVTGSSPNPRLWDLMAPDPTTTARVLRGHTQTIWSMCFSADNRWLITDASDGTIRRWSLDTPWLLRHAQEIAGRELTDDERAHYQKDNR